MKAKKEVLSNDGKNTELIQLVQKIEPKDILEKDINKFSTGLDESYSLYEPKDIEENCDFVNANVLASTVTTDTLFRSSVESGLFDANTINYLSRHVCVGYKQYLVNILENLFDQAYTVLINDFIRQLPDGVCINLFADHIVNKQYDTSYNLNKKDRIHGLVYNLMDLYIGTSNDREFAIMAVQLTILFSNDMVLTVRNDIFNLLTISNIGTHSLDYLKSIVDNASDIFGKYHDAVCDIIQHITEIISKYLYNYKYYDDIPNAVRVNPYFEYGEF